MDWEAMDQEAVDGEAVYGKVVDRRPWMGMTKYFLICKNRWLQSAGHSAST